MSLSPEISLSQLPPTLNRLLWTTTKGCDSHWPVCYWNRH